MWGRGTVVVALGAGLFGAAVRPRPDFLVLSALRQARLQQMAARHEQIGERAGHKQAMRVLVEPAVADPGEAEDALDDEERVFDLGPHFRLGPVLRPLRLVDEAIAPVTAIGEIPALAARAL